MNATLGWGLAVLAVASGWWMGGWAGVVLALTVIVFWLLLQFSRALRVMQRAAAAPKGRVASAVMLHSRLSAGLTLMQVLPLAGSLGEPRPDANAPGTECFAWTDEAGACALLTFEAGRLRHWTLERPATPEAHAVAAPTQPGAQPG